MVDYIIDDLPLKEVDSVKPLVYAVIASSGRQDTVSDEAIHKLIEDCVIYGVAMTAVVDGDVVGILLMSKVYTTASKNNCMYKDEMFYVKPAFRASRIAKELIETAVKIGELDYGVSRVSFSNINSLGEAESRGWEYLMQASGLREAGKTYVLEV